MLTKKCQNKIPIEQAVFYPKQIKFMIIKNFSNIAPKYNPIICTFLDAVGKTFKMYSKLAASTDHDVSVCNVWMQEFFDFLLLHLCQWYDKQCLARHFNFPLMSMVW